MAGKDKLAIIYFILVILLVAFLILFLFRAYIHFTELNAHRQYLKHPDAQIQSWMSIPTVAREYNISESDIYGVLNVSKKRTTSRLTLFQICRNYHLNCTEKIDRLDSLIQND